MEPQRLLSIQQVQDLLGGISRSTVYRLIQTGSLTATQARFGAPRRVASGRD